jgi:hypothetical protein
LKLVAVQVGELDAVLPHISWHLNSFAERSNGRLTVEDITDSLRAGHRQLWLAVDGAIKGAALTEVANDRASTVRLTQGAGEDAAEWAFLIEGIMEWARQRGSTAFEAVCRPGWERYFKKFGLKKTHVVMEATL